METMQDIIEKVCTEDYEKDLFRAVVQQIGDWATIWENPEDYRDTREFWPEITANMNVSGFIHYADTEKFAKRNLVNIIRVLDNLKQNLRKPPKRDNDHPLNWYAWFALETVASWVMEAKENMLETMRK